LAYTFCSSNRSCVIAVGCQEKKLFSAISGDQVIVSTVHAEHGRKADQGLVASRMAVHVVDTLEMVNVTDD
jgi:hypothetical protein